MARRLDYPYAVRTWAGHVLNVEDRSEITTVWHVYCGQEYQLPSDPRTLVDLGANIGAFSLFAAELCRTARIVAVEPFPSTFQRLQGMLRDNDLGKQVIAVQAAMHSSTGTVRMNAQAHGHSYARHLVGEGTEASVEVPAMTLAALFEQYELEAVDLLKVDIEGGEYAMLAACQPDVLRRCRVIALEYHDAARRRLIWDRLEHSGFRCTRHDARGWSGLAEFQRV